MLRRISRTILSVAALALVVSGTAMAEGHYDRYYATVGGGYTFLEGDEEILHYQTYELRGGARLNERWSFEGGFAGFPDVRDRQYYPDNRWRLGKDTWGYRFTGDALYHLDKEGLAKGWDPYLAAGVGLNHFKDKTDVKGGNTDVFMDVGVGAFYDINKSWFFKPDYRVAMVGVDTEVNHFVMLNLGYQWGRTDSMMDDRDAGLSDADAAGLKKVYFAFDSSDLDETAKANLQHNAQWMNANTDEEVVVEGHCDERGTSEYNVALGQRRAQSVFNYLKALGVSTERLTTVSYGEEFPADAGHNEGAWAQNRRVEFALDGQMRQK
jgi:peptidoglycan-associated lipoprotein